MAQEYQQNVFEAVLHHFFLGGGYRSIQAAVILLHIDKDIHCLL